LEYCHLGTVPDQNAHLLEELRRAIRDRDADSIADLLHPEAVLRLYSADEPIVGREAAREWYRQAFATRLAFEGDASGDPGDAESVVVRGRVHWYGGGRGHDQPGEWLITFRDGLIASITAQGG